MAFGRFRSSLRRSRKNINRRLCSVSAIEKSYIAKDVYIQTLLNKGVVKLQNGIDKQLLDKWKQDYNIYQSSFLPATGIITFHIPLDRITLNTSHTKYISFLCCNFSQ